MGAACRLVGCQTPSLLHGGLQCPDTCLCFSLTEALHASCWRSVVGDQTRLSRSDKQQKRRPDPVSQLQSSRAFTTFVSITCRQSGQESQLHHLCEPPSFLSRALHSPHRLHVAVHFPSVSGELAIVSNGLGASLLSAYIHCSYTYTRGLRNSASWPLTLPHNCCLACLPSTCLNPCFANWLPVQLPWLLFA